MSDNIRPVPFAPGYFVSGDGHIYSEKLGPRRLLKPWPLTDRGHLVIGFRVGRRTVDVLVHRVVATVFHGQAPTPRHEARHLDGNPRNNHKDNLAWGTHIENMADMIRHGTQGSRLHPERMPRGERHGSRTKPERVARGERNGLAKISADDVRAVRRVFLETGNISETARRVGVPRGAAKCVIHGKTWKHVA